MTACSDRRAVPAAGAVSNGPPSALAWRVHDALGWPNRLHEDSPPWAVADTQLRCEESRMRPTTTSLRAWTGSLLAAALGGLASGAAKAQPSAEQASAAPTNAVHDGATTGGAAQASTPAPAGTDADTELLRLRGLEQEPPGDGGAGRAVANALLFLPRTLLDGLLYSGAYGAHVANETSLPQYVSEITSFYHQRIGVRPLISFSTGATFDFGLEVAYRQ